jgi:site-specific DNA-methyltransferase (adenine-specific)
MGKTWDGGGIAFDPRTWQLALHVLKPGGRLLAFGAPRTHHRIWCAIEDAGFVIEDTMMWMFGSGFPKHKSKLKPFYEPVCVARKGPVTALNIDATRIESDVRPLRVARRRAELDETRTVYHDGIAGSRAAGETTEGRRAPNVAMDESAAEMLDAQTGTLARGNHPAKRRGIGFTESAGGQNAGTNGERRSTDSGGASRFLYVAKASRSERAGSSHPTMKPVALMRWLVKLVTQPGDLVLDPFAGSGTTGMACVLESREFIGIEREPEYAAIAERRIANALGPLFADTDGAA